MSAEKYTQCPQCLEVRRQKIAEKEAEIKSAYGKVDEQTFRALQAELREMEKPLDESIGEYYEIGFNSQGKFRVDYFAHCEACGYEFTFTFPFN